MTARYAFAGALASALCACSGAATDPPSRLPVAPTPTVSTPQTDPSRPRLYVAETGFVAVYAPPFSASSLPALRIPSPSGQTAHALAFDAHGALAAGFQSTPELAVYPAPVDASTVPVVVKPGPATFDPTRKGVSALAFDAAGNLWIAAGDRIVELRAPITTASTASIVITAGIPPDSVISALAFGRDGTLYALDGVRVEAYAPPYSEIVPTADVALGSSTTSPAQLVLDAGGGVYVPQAQSGAGVGGTTLLQIAYYAGPLVTTATAPGSSIGAGGSASMTPNVAATLRGGTRTGSVAGLAQAFDGTLFASNSLDGTIAALAPPLTPNSAPAYVIPCPLDVVTGSCAAVPLNSAGQGGALAFGP
jgi:hypothetical protein